LEKDSYYLFSGYLQKGEHYKMSGDLDLALDIYFKAVNIAIDLDRLGDEGVAYISIADVYSIMENYSNAVEFYDKSIEILRNTGDSISLASALLNAGDCYYNMGEYEQALQCFEEAGPIFQKLNYLAGTAYYLGNVGMIYATQGRDSLAKNNMYEAIAILEDLEDYYPISVYLTIMSDIYLKQNEFDVAYSYTQRSLKLAKEYGLKDQIADAYLQLSELYEHSGKLKEALTYYKNHILYRDSVQNLQAFQEMADMRTDFEVAQKQIEVDLLTHQRRNQKYINILAAVALLLIILLAIGIYIRYTFIKKTNVKIRTQRDEIESQRDLLEKHRDLLVYQKNEIIESINYAQRIQSAMLPPASYFSDLLSEHFILYKPRDIVSGDFYWIKQVKQYIVLAVADCTGHGIPGAFMSMLGMSYLKEIVNKSKRLSSAKILDKLRDHVKATLSQSTKGGQQDGMDIALCILKKDRKSLQYSGAFHPLYLIRSGTLSEYKPDLMPIGIYIRKEKPFKSHNIRTSKGDCFYIFSDGYADQFGGENRKKFLARSFKKLLFPFRPPCPVKFGRPFNRVARKEKQYSPPSLRYQIPKT